MKHDELVETVVRWRTALRLPQWEIAQRIGVPRGTYALWEQGRGRLKKSALARLVKALNKSRGKASVDPLTISGEELAPVERQRPARRQAERPAPAPAPAPRRLHIPVGDPALHRAAMTILSAHRGARLDPADFLDSYAEIANALDGR